MALQRSKLLNRAVGALASPQAALLLPLALLPFLLSGGVRAVTGLSLELGLAGAFAGCAAFAWLLGVPRLACTRRFDAAGMWLVSGVLVAETFALWWYDAMHGLPNTKLGVDAGNHVLVYQKFLTNPSTYAGFVGLHALMHWYRALCAWGESNTHAIYFGLRFAHYACLMAVPWALAWTAFPVVSGAKARGQRIVALLFGLVVQSALLALVVFPPVQYYQAEGFYSQIAGLYPFLLTWVLFGLCEDDEQRFLILCFGIVVQRFTYALNLGDVLVAGGIWWLFDARHLRRRLLRLGAWLFVPIAWLAAWTIYQRLYALRGMPGYFTAPSLQWVLGSQLALAFLLLVSAELFETVGISVSNASKRLWRFAGLIGLVNGTLSLTYHLYGLPRMYYAYKYGLYPSVLVAIGAAGPALTLLVHLFWGKRHQALSPRRLAVAAGWLLCGALCVVASYHGNAAYRAQALERAQGASPSVQLTSHFEPDIDRFIDRTLKAKNAKFGGYYDYFWPRMFVTNALRFELATQPDYLYNRAFDAGRAMFKLEPGHCYFFFGFLKEDYRFHSRQPIMIQLRQLWARQTECLGFLAPWLEGEGRVCSACL